MLLPSPLATHSLHSTPYLGFSTSYRVLSSLSFKHPHSLLLLFARGETLVCTNKRRTRSCSVPFSYLTCSQLFTTHILLSSEVWIKSLLICDVTDQFHSASPPAAPHKNENNSESKIKYPDSLEQEEN